MHVEARAGHDRGRLDLEEALRAEVGAHLVARVVAQREPRAHAILGQAPGLAAAREGRARRPVQALRLEREVDRKRAVRREVEVCGVGVDDGPQAHQVAGLQVHRAGAVHLDAVRPLREEDGLGEGAIEDAPAEEPMALGVRVDPLDGHQVTSGIRGGG